MSAANGTNVVQIFRDALDMGIKYKENPHKDDFMNEVMELLNETDGLDNIWLICTTYCLITYTS